MECNKEEALRAKDIAVKKLEAKDFLGARKFALKAQQLYSDVENISQMISVCEVHCSAESCMVGNDLNWYGILKIEQSADDQMIRKQYRKLALLLHPDKNKFAGAEAAFKLIGEAQRVLLDKEKRSFFDLKYRTSSKLVGQNQPPQRASRNVNGTKTSRVQNNVSSNANVTNQHSKQQAQSGADANGKSTFWTQCPFCAVRYQYFKEVIKRFLHCQSCKNPFIAYDLLVSGVRSGSDATQPVSGKMAGSETTKKQTYYASFHTEQNAEAKQSQKGGQTHVDQNKVKQGSESPRKKVNGYRGKNKKDSTESFESESSLESEEVEIQQALAKQFECDGDIRTRRSSRNKRPVSYNENVRDNELTMNHPKKAKETGSWGPSTNGDFPEKRPQPCVSASTTNESHKGECDKSSGRDSVHESNMKTSKVDDVYLSTSSPETTPEPEFVEYPDPEFCEFDKFREEQCFKVGQLWAAYDTVDAMPRFYALIRKIYPSGFKMRITWLEPDPDDLLGIAWSEAELPFSCGKFTYGGSENTEDRLMFSHQVTFEKGGSKDSFLIYPRKGETWALFKNWDSKWYLIPDSEQKFELDFVEVLSDYNETVGIHVSILTKLKGFASVFCRTSGVEIQIPPSEVLKFSHRVPCYSLSGIEREDVPNDSFELDPASATMNLEEISRSQANGDR